MKKISNFIDFIRTVFEAKHSVFNEFNQGQYWVDIDCLFENDMVLTLAVTTKYIGFSKTEKVPSSLDFSCLSNEYIEDFQVAKKYLLQIKEAGVYPLLGGVT